MPVSALHQIVQVNIPQPQKGNATAIASLTLGIFAALACWVPFIGLVAIPLGLLGLLLGVIAITQVFAAGRRGLSAAGVGTGLSVIAMVVSVLITGSVSRGISNALAKTKQPEPVAQAVPPEQKANQPEPAAQAAPPDKATAPQQATLAPPIDEPRPAPKTAKFVEYRNPARLGNVQVRISRVVRGQVPLTDRHPFPGEDGRGKSKDELLSIYLEVTNLDDGRKLDYRTPAGDVLGFNGSKLADDLGNHYRGINFGFSSKPERQTDSESVYPGKSIVDHLVFELPVAKAKSLNLELPGDHVGLEAGIFRFKIPISAVVESTD